MSALNARKPENELKDVKPEVKQDLKPELKPEVKPTPLQEATASAPVKILTERDAYLSELLDNQPSSLDDISIEVKEETHGIHRLSLPEFFEPFSYDCTRGVKCEFHGWVLKKVPFNIEGATIDRWEQTKRGKYIFRWFLNKKRAMDEARNLHGWVFVSRRLFGEAPKILFSINGAVEEGDNILGFMPAERALRKRNRPAEVSTSRVKSQDEKYKGNPNFYEAKLSPEKSEGDDYAPADALQEGRDF